MFKANHHGASYSYWGFSVRPVRWTVPSPKHPPKAPAISCERDNYVTNPSGERHHSKFTTYEVSGHPSDPPLKCQQEHVTNVLPTGHRAHWDSWNDERRWTTNRSDNFPNPYLVPANPQPFTSLHHQTVLTHLVHNVHSWWVSFFLTRKLNPKNYIAK